MTAFLIVIKNTLMMLAAKPISRGKNVEKAVLMNI